VLDICCYSGGFSLNAAKGGASYVFGIDSSASAINMAIRNAELNGYSDIVHFAQEDAKQFLAEHHELYDIVILDPPKLSPNKNDLKAASRYYFKLNQLALQRINEIGGLFLTCSCSSAMTATALATLVHDAASQIGRKVLLLSEQHAAKDHPRLVNFPEGDYLTALLFYVV
jgi:23S rRNA G2069 N7-methylase RlmK/C1962 C5-methylase RlmI